MSPSELLERLAAAGVTVELRADPAHPIWLGPVSRIPSELRPEVVASKSELAALLAQRQERTWQADPSAMPWPSAVGEDPRPDLEGSELWARLLLAASGDASDPHGTYGRLLACRACGGRLEWRGGRWRLAPTIDATERVSVWADRAAWEADAERWLRPRAREITRLLAQLPPPDGVPEP